METGKQSRFHVHLLAAGQDLHPLVAAGARRHADIQSLQPASEIPRFLNFKAEVDYLFSGQPDRIVVSQVFHHDFLVDCGEVCGNAEVKVPVQIAEKP